MEQKLENIGEKTFVGIMILVLTLGFFASLHYTLDYGLGELQRQSKASVKEAIRSIGGPVETKISSKKAVIVFKEKDLSDNVLAQKTRSIAERIGIKKEPSGISAFLANTAKRFLLK